jgi:hypothetical protein
VEPESEPEPQELSVFLLSGTGIGMYYGSGVGFGSRSNIKWNTKNSRNHERDANFLGNAVLLLLTLKGKILYNFLLLKNC